MKMAVHSTVSATLRIYQFLQLIFTLCNRLDSEAFCKAFLGLSGEQDLEQNVKHRRSGAVSELEKSLGEVTLTQAHCRRRILCRVRALTGVAAPDKILAKP